MRTPRNIKSIRGRATWLLETCDALSTQGYLSLRNVRCSFNHFLRTSEATSTTLQRCPYEVLRSYFIFDLSFSSFLLVIYSKTISTNPPFLVMSPNAPLELHQQPEKWINRWLGLVLNGLSNVASLLLENTFQCWTGNNVWGFPFFVERNSLF